MPEKNTLFLCGKIESIEVSHSYMDEIFYRLILEVPRLSHNVDRLPVVISEKLLYNKNIAVDDYITVNGQVRTRNYQSHLLVFGYTLEIRKITREEAAEVVDKNIVEFEGFICKTPVERQTGSGRRVTDLLIASNRQYNKSDYVPCIAWGINASYAATLSVGQKLSFIGRFQSREYPTRNDQGEPIRKIAYEISISRLNCHREKAVV